MCARCEAPADGSRPGPGDPAADPSVDAAANTSDGGSPGWAGSRYARRGSTAPGTRTGTGPAARPVPAGAAPESAWPAPSGTTGPGGAAPVTGDGPEWPGRPGRRAGRPVRPGRTGRGGGSGGTRAGSADARLPGPLLRQYAERRPQAVPALPYPSAAVTGTAGCSYAELDRRARAVAARLGARLRPGSRVLLVYPQGPDLAGAFFGCLYAGMAAVPLVPPAPGATGAVARAVRRCAPDIVLTGSDAWTPLAVDRTRTQVLEADGVRVGGEPVWRLAQGWRPVGVLPGAPAYQRYHDDGAAGGRLEPAMSHSDLADVTTELAQAVRLGTDEENVGWIAAVHGVEDAVWRVLLPVRVTG